MNDRRSRTSQRTGVEIDEIDRRLLNLLTTNARMANTVLAQQSGIAPSTSLMRVKRLRDTGVITGFRADVAPGALGRVIQAVVSVRLRPGARATIGDFGARLASLPGVTNVYFVAGVQDFQVHVAVRSTEELKSFVVDHLSVSHEVASTETNVILEHIRSASIID